MESLSLSIRAAITYIIPKIMRESSTSVINVSLARAIKPCRQEKKEGFLEGAVPNF